MLDGDLVETAFSNQQLSELEKTLLTATRNTGAVFTAYVGALPQGRDSAIALHGALAGRDRTVLVAVDPEQRVAEVVTGPEIRDVLDDQACRLACLTMTSRFSIGDIAAGVRDGVIVLADHSRALPSMHTNLPD